MLGYLCAYYRYHYPLQFLCSFLNNAANDDDIVNGTSYAEKIGVKVTMPKFGVSKGEYFYDTDNKIISKGISSIKYMGEKLANRLYEMAHAKKYDNFTDIMVDINDQKILDKSQLEILIKLDFFSDFGNQRELLRLKDMFYDTYKRGEAKQIDRQLVDGTPLEPIIQKYGSGKTKAGTDSKRYTILDMPAVLRETENAIKAVGMEDLSIFTKVQNFISIMGYMGMTTGRDEDRPKLYIEDLYPLKRKSDGKQFGYSFVCKSIGSGKESRFSVFNRTFDECPVMKGDIILCTRYEREGPYFKMTSYKKIY